MPGQRPPIVRLHTAYCARVSCDCGVTPDGWRLTPYPSTGPEEPVDTERRAATGVTAGGCWVAWSLLSLSSSSWSGCRLEADPAVLAEESVPASTRRSRRFRRLTCEQRQRPRTPDVPMRRPTGYTRLGPGCRPGRSPLGRFPGAAPWRGRPAHGQRGTGPLRPGRGHWTRRGEVDAAAVKRHDGDGSAGC